jgi:hypothetical protein
MMKRSKTNINYILSGLTILLLTTITFHIQAKTKNFSSYFNFLIKNQDTIPKRQNTSIKRQDTGIKETRFKHQETGYKYQETRFKSSRNRYYHKKYFRHFN